MTLGSSRQLLNYFHTDNEKEYKPCIVKLFKKYMTMVNNLSRRNEAFYFHPSKTAYKFEDYPVRIHTLNSIFPSLTTADSLERKTAHSIHITCASTLLQNDVEEKRIRERTEHISNALFKYEKPSKEQSKCVSECSGPPSITKGGDNLEKYNPEVVNEEIFLEDDLDEDLANLNYEELLDTNEIKNSEAGGRNFLLDNIFCNSNLCNTTVNFNVNLMMLCNNRDVV